MKNKKTKRLLSFITSITLIFSLCCNILFGVSAENTVSNAIFSYGDFDGVETAIGDNPDNILISGDKITLPENNNALNLYWENGEKLYKAGTEVSVSDLVKDGDGDYKFVAKFGSFTMDYDDIDTEPFTFYTQDGPQVDTFFGQFHKNKWWGIPTGYANDGTSNTAFGANNFTVKKRTGDGESGNYLFMKKWAASGTYFNAAFFSHSPFDTTDVNSHNSNATGTINYKYAYFTPGEEYTITFDYMLDTTDGGEPPYSASIAFGMDTKTGQNNCAQKTIEYADGKVARTNVNLGTENGKWKTTSVTVKAPEDYTGNDITSARMGISLKVKTGNGCYIDNVRVQLNGSKVYFKYGESSDTSSVFGDDLVAYTDEEGNITLPNNESAINLLWKHGDNLYEPGTNLNVNGLGKEVTFTAYFGGATLDFEDICTNSIQMVDKSSSNKQNLYRELNRNPGYWKVPQGLSNTSVKTNYGTALGHHSMGIISSVGKTGKGLQLEIRKNYTPEYREAVLFNHSPTTFTETSNITYGYVYYNTNTEYTMEFDYKTTASVDVTVAFGVDTNWTNTSSGVAIKSVNSNDFTKKDSYITLESTNGEWAHASITIKSPSSYVGNGVTSARVGIAVKDNEATASDAEKRYDYFDNIVFYPTSMDYETVKIIYGAETSDEDCQTISYFKPKAPLKSNTSILLPENGTINACVRTGTNNNGSWKAPYGKISNLIGWEIQGSDKVYSPQDNVNVSDLPKNAVISAIYGDEMVDFENLDDSFKIFNSNSTSYGSKSATIISENENKFVRLEGQPESTDKTYSHILAFTESGKFAAYNINTTYKITFKMRRLDNVDKESKVYFAFGATPFDWRANNTRVAYSEICVAKKGMSDFDTYTVVVTSPNNYASVKGSEKFYSRAMAIGAELSEGVIIDFDDIKIEAIGLDGDDFGIATFDFGMSEKFGDTKTFKFANSVFLPGKQVVNAAKRSGTNQENVDWQTNHGKVSNHTAWYCNNNKKYYQLGEKVSADEVGKNPTFTAVYEGGSVDFNNLSNDFEFRKDNDTSYSASFAKIEGSTNKYVNLTGNEIQDNTSTQVLLFNETNEFLSYNLNKKYKVSFKYRRTDSENVNSQLYFAFGAIPWGWRAASGCVNKIVIGEAKKGMTEFETVTIYVTAPNTYEYNAGGSNPEYFHSRTMAIGATLSNGVSIDFDDIIVEPVDFEGKDIGVATFDFGMSDKFNDTKTIEFTDTLHLPIQQSPKAGKRSGTNEKGQYWQTVHGQVSNHTAWYCNNNKKYYQLGEEVSVDEVGKNPTFTAVYEGGSVDFNNLSNDFEFRKDNDTSYSASLAKVKGSTNKYVNLTGGEEHKNTSVQVLLFNDTNRFLSYNTSETYKVTFKYRRTDSKNVNSQLYFAFGAIPWGWRAASGCVNKIVIGEAKKGMTEFETVTIYVTAPNTYEYSTGGSNPEYFHSRTMAIGATLSNGVSIDFDDIIVEPVDFEGKDIGVATFDFGMSDKFNDTKTIEFTDTLHLPIQQSPKAGKRSGTNEKGQYWQTVHGQVSNHTAWYCNNNKKYYQLGEEVSVDEVGKNPTFTAVYEGGSVDFNNLSNDFEFRKDNDTSYSASLAKVKGSTNKYVNLTGGEEHKNTSVQVLLFNDTNRFLSYNTSETYKVTFKYRRTDSKNVNSQLYFAFGAIPWGWRAASGCVNKIVIGEAKKGMTEFETVTIYVTAPNTYEYSTGGSNPEYFHSRTMAIGATLSNGVSIDFDDIIVEPIAHDEIAMTFTVPEKKTQKVIIGKAGAKLTIPNVELDRNSVIDGWFFDEGFTKEFTLKTFPTNDMIVYGKVGPATVRYYGFTEYPWDTSIREGSYARKEHHIIEDGFSSDGDGYALKIDNTIEGANEEQQGVALPLKIKPNTKYLISFDFYYENVGDRASAFSEFWFNTSVSGLLWKGIQQNITNEDEYTPANIKEKKWYTGYVYGTTTEFTWSNGLSLFFRVPVGSVCFVDNIIVTEIPEEQSIALLKVGSFQSPEPIVASKNSTIKLPKVKLEGNYAFLNWILKNEEYTADTYVLSEDTIFTAKTTASRFSEGFENTYYGKRGITSFGMDFDWEIYDSQSGNNSNVKGGRYSLHRIGKDIRNTAYCFHHNSDVTEYTMAEGQIYTVSFWVKVENPVHKLGSIDIASCISLGNPWDFPADRFNVTAISDIADGEWHKVSYTMMASGPYLSIVVPGNLSIYIDDLTVEYTPTATKSENCSFEEYIPAYLTADGKYIKPDLDADELGKFELVKRTDETSAGNDGTSLLIIVICAVAVIVLMGGTAVTILLIRKKKNIGGKKS